MQDIPTSYPTTTSQQPDAGIPPLNLWWVIGICGILGALYGYGVLRAWSEVVEFAQVWAGLVTYPSDNPYGQIMLGDPSLQISFPALLLRCGVGTWTLSVATVSFCCTLAFAAVGSLCFALTRQLLVAIAATFVLLTYYFANPFAYPIHYPFVLEQFGQTGQYLCMIAFAFIACRQYISGGIIAGSLIAIHTVWWLACLLGIFFALLLIEPQQIKRMAIYIVSSSVLSFLFYKLCMLPLPSIELLPDSASFSGIRTLSDFLHPIRKTFQGHNILLSDSPNPWHTAIGIFLPLVLWMAFAGIYIMVLRRQTIAPLLSTSGARLLALTLPPVGAAILYQCFIEFDPHLFLIAKLNPHLPNLVLRAIISRWLDLTSFILPLLPLAILTLLANNQRSLLALAALAYMFYFTTLLWNISAPYNASVQENFVLFMPPHTYFFVSVALLAVFNRWEPKFNYSFVPNLCRAALSLFCLIVFIQNATTAWDKTTKRNQELAAGKFNQITAFAKQEEGPIIYAPFLRGTDFIPQLMFNRPSIIPFYLNVDTSYGNLYCYTNPYERIEKEMSRGQSCFEGRTKAQWLNLAKLTHATALIVPEGWKINLIPAFTGDGLNYYRLQQ